jgi:Tol biopolymer transport system component
VAYDLVSDIYTMNADGSGQTRRTRYQPTTNPFMYSYRHPVWSPDGRRIALVHGELINADQLEMRFRVMVISPDGVVLQDLAWAGDGTSDPGSLAWSPDGLGIAYSFIECDPDNLDCTNSRSVKYVSLDGRHERTLVPNAHSPAWRR